MLISRALRAAQRARPGGCGADARWARVHGRDVSHRAGLPRHTLYGSLILRLSARRYPRKR